MYSFILFIKLLYKKGISARMILNNYGGFLPPLYFTKYYGDNKVLIIFAIKIVY